MRNEINFLPIDAHQPTLCSAFVFYVVDIKPSETTAEITHSSTGSSSPSDWVSSLPLRYSELPKPCVFDCVRSFIGNLECASFYCARTLVKKHPSVHSESLTDILRSFYYFQTSCLESALSHSVSTDGDSSQQVPPLPPGPC